MVFDDILTILVLLLSLCLSRNAASSSPTHIFPCPIDLNFVLKIPWDKSSCRQNYGYGDNRTCCQTLISLYGIGFAQYLKKTSLFRLPDMETSISCLSDFQAKLDSLSLPSSLTSMCFDPQSFVKSTNICADIQTKNDWIDVIGASSSSSLEIDCKSDLTDLTSCDACVMAGFKVHAKLLSVDKNSSHGRGCFHYTVLYAAAFVNEQGPDSRGAVSCIFGLPVTFKEEEEKSRNTEKLALVFGSVGAGSSIFVVFFLVGLWRLRKRRRKKRLEQAFSQFVSDSSIPRSSSRWTHWRTKSGAIWFKIQELEKATEYFSPKNFIGRGQSGIVYKGILKDGSLVAVKKLITDSDFHGRWDSEFLNEVEILSRLNHRNLVPLRGYCYCSRDSNSSDSSQRYLVYDYMPNGNLSDHLFFSSSDNNKRRLTWCQRQNIILDVAKAIVYLHYGVKPAIYHRDIKAKNILLDKDMRARIADFGLVRQNRGETDLLETRVAGTQGYLAPEYALYGQLTKKSDVYSFGIVILEIMSGRKVLGPSPTPSPMSPPLESSSSFLVTDWAWSLVKAGKMEEVFDASLVLKRNTEEYQKRMLMERFLLVGILCAHLMVALRPTILDALRMLEGDIPIPEILDRPVFADLHKPFFLASLPQLLPFYLLLCSLSACVVSSGKSSVFLLPFSLFFLSLSFCFSQMGDPTTSTSTSNFYGILGLPKSASIGDIGKAYKFLATRWNPEKNSSNRAEAEAKIKSIDEAYRVLSVKKREEGNGSNHDRSKSLGGSSNHHHHNNNKSSENPNSIMNNNGQYDDFIISSPSLISSTSRRVTPTGTPRASLSKNSSRRSITPTSRDFFYSHSRSSSEISNPASPSTPTDPVALYKMASKRNSTPIIFSQSTVRKTPPPIEKKLECTLEELCHGCVKNVTIKREVISNEGIFVEEEEGLQIRIKPGWKKGTKITFEGKGDEKPGMHPADIIFVIEEKRHSIFKREGDDLELGVQIPLVEALTGLTLSVPLLGGGKINLSLGDEIIFPGYEKIIYGQGMPCCKEGFTNFSRGDLRLRFFVIFPRELTDEQRSDIVSILQDSS